MTQPSPFALVVVVLFASSALAQTTPARVERDKAAVTFQEVERGFYFGLTAGPWFLLNPPATAGSPRPFSRGQTAQIEMGMTFAERFSIGLFVTGTNNVVGAEYTGKSGGLASGDFAALIPGLVARVNAVGFDDDQGVKRTWLYVRLGGGYAMFTPKALLPNADILLFAGPGIEYFTRLRHFSVGLEVTGAYLLSDAAFGFAVTPNLRYSF